MGIDSLVLDGLLVVDKPGRDDLEPRTSAAAAGQDDAAPRPYLLSSHDVVARVRRWSGQRRIGHTGTLDPMASGLLLLCLGNAARLVEFYQHQDKQYLAEVALGAATDTYDAAGTVVDTASVPLLTAASVDRALDGFRGVVEQQPPAFSAIKQEGKALYALARRGEQVDAPTRTVTFHRIELIDVRLPDRIVLRVKCSAGAYIRSLAHDLGRALGTVAHLRMLRREAIDAFTLADAHDLDAIDAACRSGALAGLLLPPGDRLTLPAHIVDDDTLRRLGFGQIVLLDGAACEPVRSLAIARDGQGRLAGIIRRLGIAADGVRWKWKAEKWMQ